MSTATGSSLIDKAGRKWCLACDDCLKPLVNAGGHTEMIGEIHLRIDPLIEGDTLMRFAEEGDFFDSWIAADAAAEKAGWLVERGVRHLCLNCAQSRRTN